MSEHLADVLRATLPVLQHATLFGTPAQQADAKRRRDAAAAALVAWDTRHLRLPEAYRVTWEIDTFNASTPREAAQEALRTMRRIDSEADFFTVRGRDGTITEVDLSHD